MTDAERSTGETLLIPFFADTGRGRRLAISTRSTAKSRGSILLVPPFAEEMNKSRRMTALAASALAEDGWHVLRVDLHGCGDSEGETGNATWSGWLADIDFWVNWLNSRTDGPLLLWGLRAGALLAADWLEQECSSIPLLLWNPVPGGQQHLTQFLRLRAAADMLDSQKERGVVSQLRRELANGVDVTVAGYTLSPKLANPLAGARLKLPEDYDGAISILEVLPEGASQSPAIRRVVESWQEAAVPTSYAKVVGPPFWRTVEIEIVPELIQATVKAARELVS